MLDGDISNRAAPSVACNVAAMFDVEAPKLLGLNFGKRVFSPNRFALVTSTALHRMAINRILLVERPDLWNPIQKMKDDNKFGDLEPTYIVPIFYPDHYATLRAQYPDLIVTYWHGANNIHAPSYEEVICDDDRGVGWARVADAARAHFRGDK